MRIRTVVSSSMIGLALAGVVATTHRRRRAAAESRSSPVFSAGRDRPAGRRRAGRRHEPHPAWDRAARRRADAGPGRPHRGRRPGGVRGRRLPAGRAAGRRAQVGSQPRHAERGRGPQVPTGRPTRISGSTPIGWPPLPPPWPRRWARCRPRPRPPSTPTPPPTPERLASWTRSQRHRAGASGPRSSRPMPPSPTSPTAYGLTQVAVAGLSPKVEPDVDRLAVLADRIRRTGTTTVFSETLVSPAVARALAREAGCRPRCQSARGSDHRGALGRGGLRVGDAPNIATLAEALDCTG